MRDAIERISAGEADIIVGTQIVAKGHHFPQLSFVGVVDADLGLGNGDLRAAERTYQLLSQVAGRSGRSVDVAGFAMLQSHMPELACSRHNLCNPAPPRGMSMSMYWSSLSSWATSARSGLSMYCTLLTGNSAFCSAA